MKKVFGNLKILSIENNNLSSWREIQNLAIMFPNLEELFIGDNNLLFEDELNDLK